MNDILASLILLACTVAALVAARSRGVLTHMIVEGALLLTIGAFLAWRGISPLPRPGSLPVGLAGSWARALAVTWWLLGARLVVNFTSIARGRDPRSRNARLFSDLAAAVIYITSVLIVLNSVLDLNVRSLVVTSGVVAIVLGLALQNTLADVFSGIAVGLERPFQVGDLVSVGDGLEGVVVQIDWRSVRIQTDGDDLATIPNSIIAKGTITNRSVPTRRRAVTVQVAAPAQAMPETVLELMRQASLLCESILTRPPPSFTITRAGLYSAGYAARFFVADSPAAPATRSLFLRQTRRLFRHAGISHPDPISTVQLLGSLAMFSALSTEALDTLAASLIAHTVEPGETIFTQGASATSLYVITAGVLEISRDTASSRHELLGRLGAGDVIGELGLAVGAPRAFTVTALTRGQVLELSGAELARVQQSNPAVKAALSRSAQRDLALIDQNDLQVTAAAERPEATLLARARALFRV